MYQNLEYHDHFQTRLHIFPRDSTIFPCQKDFIFRVKAILLKQLIIDKIFFFQWVVSLLGITTEAV